MHAGLFRMNLMATLALTAPAASAIAQDFRVSTAVYDENGEKGRRTQVGSSTALFHAGKVYDNVGQGPQMTIFDPAHERFLLLDEQRRMMTGVSFGFITEALEYHEKNTASRLQGMKPNSRDAQLLRFQIEPDFTSAYDSRAKQLTLRSPVMTYTIACDQYPIPEVVDAYLNYADWAARLNFVVDPRAMLPTARIDVDTSLREQKALPVVVSRQVPGGSHLRAEHKYYWELSADDRKTIHKWESLLAAKQLRAVRFEDYQEPRLKEAAQTGERRPGSKPDTRRTSAATYRPVALSSR